MLLNAFMNVILPRPLTPGPSRGNEANINTDVHLDGVWVFRSKLLCSRQLNAFYCARPSIIRSAASSLPAAREDEKAAVKN